MSETEEENGNGTSAKGRPNAYFAKIKEEQEEALAGVVDNYGGAFRGVKPAPHGGAVHVRPDQIIGTLDLCWCGSPLGHDWPGKSVGAKHPKVEEGSMNTAISTTIDRRDLRAYHRRLQDFIIACVNNDGLRFRVGKNSTILYPKDDTTPMTVHARNTDRQLRQLQKWYVEHVYVAPADEEPVTTEDLAALAQAKNNPAEHPDVPQVQEQPETPVVSTTNSIPTMETMAQSLADTHTAQEARWTPWLRSDQQLSPNVETDGTRFRCTWCLNTDHPLDSENPRSIGGHNRIYHTDTSDMHSPQARAKAVTTNRSKRAQQSQAHAAIAALIEIHGYEVESPNVELEKALAEALNVAEMWQGRYEQVLHRAEEAEAKLALIREATGL